MKTVKRRARRALRSAGDEEGSPAWRRFVRLSARCTREAIERATGLT